MYEELNAPLSVMTETLHTLSLQPNMKVLNRNPGFPYSRDFEEKSGQDSELKPYGRGGMPKITIENTELRELQD